MDRKGRRHARHSQPQGDFTLADLILFLARGWKVIALYSAVVFVVTVYQYRSNPSYTASSLILIETSRSNTLQAVTEKFSGMGGGMAFDDSDQKLDKYLIQLLSRSSMEYMAREILKGNPGATLRAALDIPKSDDRKLASGTHEPTQEEIFSLGSTLRSAVSYEKAPSGNLRAMVSLPDRKAVTELLNLVQDLAVKIIIERESKDLSNAREFLETKSSEIERRLEVLDDAISDLMVSSMMHGSAVQKGDRLEELETKLLQMRVDFRQNEAVIKELEESVGGKVDETYLVLNDKYSPMANLLNLRRQRNLMKLKIESLEKSVEYLKESRKQSPNDEKAINDLYKKKELEYQLFADLKREIMNLDVQKISIMNKARPLQKVYDNETYRAKSLIPGLVQRLIFALLFAALTVYLYDFMNPMIKEHRDLAGMGIYSLGSIPNLDRRQKRNFLRTLLSFRNRRRSNHHMHNVSIEADSIMDLVFKNLRARVMNFRLQDKEHHTPQVVSVMSPLSGEGKTSLTSNLAKSIALSGRRVLLVDCDLRKHSLTTAMKKEGLLGLCEYITSPGEKFDRPIVQNIAKNLDLLPSGHFKHEATELLAGPLFAEMIKALRNFYDYIVLDTPPAVPYSEIIPIAASSDLVLLSLMSNQTTVDALDRAIDKIQYATNTPIAYVLNRHEDGSLMAYYPYYAPENTPKGAEA